MAPCADSPTADHTHVVHELVVQPTKVCHVVVVIPLDSVHAVLLREVG